MRSIVGPLVTVLALGYGNSIIYFYSLTLFSIFSGILAYIWI